MFHETMRRTILPINLRCLTALRLLPVGIALTMLTGCPKSGETPGGGASPRALTADQFQLLRDKEQIRYRNIILRVPNSFGGVLLPASPGAYDSVLDKAIHTGDLNTLMGLYNQTMFEIAHPRVKIEYLNFDMWSDNFNSQLAVALSGNRAPAYYVARNLPQTIEQGMYADITPLVAKWDEFKNQPNNAVHEGVVNGRIYTVASGELSANVIRYRKDWFREAGIFNEFGEPGPRSDWTWEDFRKIAKKLTDPAKNRYGFAGEPGDFQFNQAYGTDPLYIPDPTGKRTWIFNDRDPLLLESLKNAREMVNVDKSVEASVSMKWMEWHAEFDAGRAGMIMSWAAHPPRESMDQPLKFGPDKLFADTVGMAPPPHGPGGLSGLKQQSNLMGFDPTLKPEQLAAAFEWVKAQTYGDIFQNSIRQATQEAKIKGRKSTLYAQILTLPYTLKENPLDQPLEKVFPPDYIRTYKAIKESKYPPLPREFGLREPAQTDLQDAVKALYSEAISSNGDLKAIIAKNANVINTNVLGFRGKEDGPRLKKYIDARSAFYRTNFPKYYETVWKPKLATTWKVSE